MKHVFFEKIDIKNFISVGKDPITLSYRPGVNVITGANLDKEESGNGVGKSSITESLYFCLFGTTLRELKASQIKHYSAKDPCEVTAYFRIEESDGKHFYELTRMASPSKVHLLKDGVDVTPSTIPKTNELIKDIIGANQEVFQNSVIMAANSAVAFMSQRKVDKRKFLEGILGLGVFGEMLLLARQDFNNTKSDYSVEYSKYATQIKSVANMETLFKDHKIKKKERALDFEKRIDNNQSRIDSLQQETQELQKELKKYKESTKNDDTDKTIKKLNSTATNLVHEYAGLSHEKRSLEQIVKEQQSLPEVCPSCSRKLTQKMLNEASQKIKNVAKEIKNIEGQIQEKKIEEEVIREKLAKLQIKRDAAISEVQEIKFKVRTAQNNNKAVTEYRENIKTLKRDIINIDAEDASYENNIKLLQNEANELQKAVQDLDKKLEIYKISKFIVSEEGIRSFVVRKILKVLNSRLAYYLNALDAPCTCEFDQYFVETLVNEKGHECSYYNFSAGERKRIDLAILFTFQDLRRLQSDTTLNLSMYDELLDSSLDGQGIKNVMKVLDKRVEKYNECVYIVTHRPDAVDTISGEIIFLEKENGVTKIATC